MSKTTAVPGAPALHPYPSLIPPRIGQGKGKHPTEHPALQAEAGHVIINPGPNPHVLLMIYPKGRCGHPFQPQSELLSTHAV